MDEAVKLLGVSVVFSGIGGALALERRCLGQMALVQPLLVCFLAGWVIGQPEVGLWLGTCLQLFSLLPRRGLDWSTAGLCAAATLYLSSLLGFKVEVGSPAAVVVLLVSSISILTTSVIDRWVSFYHARLLTRAAPLSKDDARVEVARFVNTSLYRLWTFGSLALFLYIAVALFAAALFSRIPLQNSWTVEVAAVGAPLLAMAVALGSMARRRLLAWALVGATLGLGAMLL
ncbi:MAG: PTS sugar transporter subunit IIC [Myxococcota bacterium]|jgi:mannose/fructose/N-acetylgalactosamine-specific phosphotransferase system component IIC|nr:PTS sugar transporter subunit IIC [Myxococcota bacterium]